MVGVEILGFRDLPLLIPAPSEPYLSMSEKKSLKLKFKGEKSHKKHKTDEVSGSRKRKREEDDPERDKGWYS